MTQPLLIVQPIRHVINELISTDAIPVIVQQDIESHFVGAAIQLWITILPDLRKLLASQRAAPHRSNRCLLLRLRSEQFKHARTDNGTLAEDAFELVCRRFIDGEPSVFKVGDLNEGVRPFHDIRQKVAFRERLRDSALERLVERAQAFLRMLSCRDVAGGAEPFDDLASCIEQRHGTGERPAERTVDEPHAMLELECAFRGDCRLDRRRDARLVVPMNISGEPRVALERSRRIHAPRGHASSTSPRSCDTAHRSSHQRAH